MNERWFKRIMVIAVYDSPARDSLPKDKAKQYLRPPHTNYVLQVMVPKRLKKNQGAVERIHGEIKDNYLLAVKKSTVDFVLDEPEIDADERFLDEDDETPLTIELAGE